METEKKEKKTGKFKKIVKFAAWFCLDPVADSKIEEEDGQAERKLTYYFIKV